MKNRFWLCRRGRTFYLWDTHTGKRESLRTTSKSDAQRLVQARNEATNGNPLNLALGKVYLAGADPRLVERTWSLVMEEYTARGGRDSTQLRRQRGIRSKPFDLIRHRKLIETTQDDFRAVMAAGGAFTNHFLRCLHNLAIGLGWLPWPIIPPKLWPTVPSKPKRAITWAEHQRLVGSECNAERKAFYEFLWETGAGQSDAAGLGQESIDWNTRTLSFQRKKTGEWARLAIGSRLEELIRSRPAQGRLFPTISATPNGWRAAEFRRRCRVLKIEGISLHSYRYAWAERANRLGVPERFAQQALGHSSTAVHHAYARRAEVRCPSLEDYEKKVVAVEFTRAPTPQEEQGLDQGAMSQAKL